MARPRFSEMLVNRRRQLGLSTGQAARVLRFKEDVLRAFEEGDFDSMPKSGYAQGMLSSYARYLGLNPRQVTNQFAADLSDWEHGGSGRSIAGRGGSRRRRGEEPTYELPGRSRYQGTRGLLPTSGGYAGDVYGYTTTSSAYSRNHRPASRVDDRRSGRGIREGRAQDGRGRGRGEERRYSGRDLSTYSSGRDAQRSARYRAQADRSGYASRYRGSEGAADQMGRDRVSVRRVTPSEYTDDLRYDDARPYEAASTRSGRQSSRNIANVGRPNVARRQPQRGRAPQRQPERGGVLGVIQAFFSDPRRTLAFVLVVAGVILTMVIISSIGSCVNKDTSSGRTVSVSSTSDNSGSSSSSNSSSTTTSAEAEKAAADALAAKKSKEEANTKTETKVEVKVDDGEVSWVEIENDGKSVVAEQITGPWSQSFTVTSKFTIQVSDTAAVTVTKNGETQKFESKTSGIGTITIEGTKATTSTSANGTSATGTTDANATSTQSDGTSTTTTSSTTSTQSDQASATTSSTDSSRTAPSASSASYSYFSKGR